MISVTQNLRENIVYNFMREYETFEEHT